MNCPHCSKSIDPALITAARQSELGSRDRPGAIGLVRRGCKHMPIYPFNKRGICFNCGAEIRWSATRNTFLLARKKEGAK